jgi:hypothetical protein
MPDDKPPPPYGTTVLVAVGWYLTLAATAWITSQSAGLPSDPVSCGELGCGWGRIILEGALVIGGASLVIPTLVIAKPASRWLRSAPLAVTFTAFASFAVVALLALIANAARHR